MSYLHRSGSAPTRGRKRGGRTNDFLQARLAAERRLGRQVGPEAGLATTELVELERACDRLIRVRDTADAKAELDVARLARVAFVSNRELELRRGCSVGAANDAIAIVALWDRDVNGVLHGSSLPRRRIQPRTLAFSSRTDIYMREKFVPAVVTWSPMDPPRRRRVIIATALASAAVAFGGSVPAPGHAAGDLDAASTYGSRRWRRSARARPSPRWRGCLDTGPRSDPFRTRPERSLHDGSRPRNDARRAAPSSSTSTGMAGHGHSANRRDGDAPGDQPEDGRAGVRGGLAGLCGMPCTGLDQSAPRAFGRRKSPPLSQLALGPPPPQSRRRTQTSSGRSIVDGKAGTETAALSAALTSPTCVISAQRAVLRALDGPRKSKPRDRGPGWTPVTVDPFSWCATQIRGDARTRTR